MPLKDGSYKGANWATRRALLVLLKTRGTLSSQEMASELGISPMAIRQHMQELEASGDVSSENRSQGKGRPSKYWTLTPQAAQHFPDRHRDLMLDLIGSVKSVLGEEAMDKVLDERSEQQARVYSERMLSCLTVGERAKLLAEIRTEEGYMAELEVISARELRLVENHCPICSAAEVCAGLCSRELRVFEKALGPNCKVERVEHMLTNGRRCAYRITVG